MTVDTLRDEREGRTVPLTLFYSEYKKEDNKICYGFVEGKDDPSYYRGIIQSRIPRGCSVILYPTGGKKAVSNIYKLINWEIYSKNRIIFFMDRDLSDIIDDPDIIQERNVYITDNYSIENDIICHETLEAVMRDLLGFSSTPQKEINKIITLFHEQKKYFTQLITPLMANIIIWKKNHLSPANYANIQINHIIKVNKGTISPKLNAEKTIELFYKQSNMDLNNYDESTTNYIIDEIHKKGICDKITRGKYLTFFFITFCNSIYKDCSAIKVTKTHTGRTLCSKDIMETIAPRSKAPESLHIFLTNTVKTHYNDFQL